jgi:hypothetical protein
MTNSEKLFRRQYTKFTEQPTDERTQFTLRNGKHFCRTTSSYFPTHICSKNNYQCGKYPTYSLRQLKEGANY